MVAFTDHERLIGEQAKDQMATNRSNTVYGKLSLLYFLITVKMTRMGHLIVSSPLRCRVTPSHIRCSLVTDRFIPMLQIMDAYIGVTVV